jgi:predicted transcriptional regulator of viral defense system
VSRRPLETLHREFATAFTVAEAADALGIDTTHAHRVLSYLSRRGWLARVRRGLYVAVPLEARVSGQWREDAWIVAAKTFGPCYIGGWSACEHWGLTEQLFRTVVVITTRRVRDRRPTLQETPFRVKTIQESHFFGTRTIWRGQSQLAVSDPTRTVVDILDDPRLGGGIQHVAAVLAEYLTSEHRADDVLLDYSTRIGNRSVFKRLGYLTEVLALDGGGLAAQCHERLSAGVTLLDPSGPRQGEVDSRWGLRVNASVRAAA